MIKLKLGAYLHGGLKDSLIHITSLYKLYTNAMSPSEGLGLYPFIDMSSCLEIEMCQQFKLTSLDWSETFL